MTLRVALVALATFRLTRFVVEDSFPPMRRIRDKIALRASPVNHRPISSFVDEVITCWWCTSIWIAAGVTALADRWLSSGLASPVLVALAASAFTGVLATVLPDWWTTNGAANGCELCGNLGEPELAVWCDTCLLPSALRVRIALLIPDSMTVLNISNTLCEGCQVGTAVTDE